MIYKLAVRETFEAGDKLQILEWRVNEGDAIVKGQLLVELESFKAVLEVRTGQDGIVRKLLRQAGEWERVGSPLALISDTPDEALPESLDEVESLSNELQFL